MEKQPVIQKLGGHFSLRSKEESWKPDTHARQTIESHGYVIGETIGEGVASKVKKTVSKRMNETVAMKIIRKCEIEQRKADPFVKREIALLQQLQHPGLLDIYGVYESSNNFYIAMEYVPNGDLLGLINKMGSIGEVDSRRIFKQLMNVVGYLHDNGICHRDIKCDNILLDKFYNVKLIDFGFSRWIPPDHMTSTQCGSFVYTAPEVVEGNPYDVVKADIWSLGVCLYAMLCGQLPFRDDDIDVLRDSFKMKIKFYKHVSKECKELLRQVLHLDPSRRPTLAEIYCSSWMCKQLGSGGASSVSSLSVAAVMDSHNKPDNFDPYAEHGFNCHQAASERKPSLVSNILNVVADNHRSGKSSVDLSKVMLPSTKTSSVAMITGVTGPIGKKISHHLGMNAGTGGSMLNVKQSSLIGGIGEIAAKGLIKKGFGDKFKALQTFRAAANVVTAIRRMRRKPLDTILNMPQAQAMKKIVNTQENQTMNELKHLHFSEAGKVASRCGVQHNEMAAQEIESKREQQEKIECLNATVAKLLPDDSTSNEQS